MPIIGLRICLCCLLTVTAATKFFDATAILGSNGLLASHFRLSLAVGFEIMAVGVIALAPTRFAQRFATLTFLSFTFIAAWTWWVQMECGCFGSKTPKGVPIALDITAIVLLLSCHRRVAGHSVADASPYQRRLIWALIISLFAGSVSFYATHWRIRQLSSETDAPTWYGTNLVGKRFPLVLDEKFATVVPESGDALIVMLRPNCKHCRELTKHWPEVHTRQPLTCKTLCISIIQDQWTVMPSRVSHVPLGLADEFAVFWEALKEPLVLSPTFIAVRDRVVVGVRTGEDAAQLIHQSGWIDQLFENDAEF